MCVCVVCVCVCVVCVCVCVCVLGGDPGRVFKDFFLSLSVDIFMVFGCLVFCFVLFLSFTAGAIMQPGAARDP